MVGVLIGRLAGVLCGRFVNDHIIRNVKLTNQPTDHATKQPIKQPNQSMCDRLATHALIVDQTNLLQHWLCLGTRTPVPEQTHIFTDKDNSHDCVQNVVYQQMCAYLKNNKSM